MKCIEYSKNKSKISYIKKINIWKTKKDYLYV